MLLACACPSLAQAQNLTAMNKGQASSQAQPDLERRDARYRLCASDVIALTFPLTPEFDQTVSIQPDGFASLMAIGDVHLEGLTTQESAAAVRTAYSGILNAPIVTIDLKDFNKPYFIAGGQVGHPGKYDLRGETSATQAIAIAGGFNDSSKHSQVLLFRRVNSDWYEVKPLNSPGPLKTHERPVPRLGGAAVFIAVFAAAILANPHRAFSAWTFFAALALVFAAGFVDDLRGVSPIFRLAAQFAAGALLWTGGWRFALLGSGALGGVAVCGSVAAFANAVNLLDGMDAIAAGNAGIIAVAYLALPAASLSPFARTIAWTLAAACLGFLLYNWPPAKLFLGDGGSTVLGFLIAFLAVDFHRARPATTSSLLFPLLVVAVPLFDAVFAALRRLRYCGSPFQGDRRHIYDLMAARSWPIRRIALSLYAITAAFGAIGQCAVRNSSWWSWTGAVAAVGLFLCVAIRMGSLRADTSAVSAIPETSRLMQDESSLGSPIS